MAQKTAPCNLQRPPYPRGSAAKLLGTPSSDQLHPEDKPHPTTPTIVKKDPRHPTTHVSTKARLPEDPTPPASRTNKRPKPRPPRTHIEDLEVHPLEPAEHMSPLQTEENPYTLGPRLQGSNPATLPTNTTELRRKTPNTPAKPWNSSYGAPPCPDNPGASRHRWH
ncbi:hypothetical protein C0989_008019 [Termitomyces sp. Mn162]|nr:hypothetical protein C0989_008019 [Termitomyces sp. Mn162]